MYDSDTDSDWTSEWTSGSEKEPDDETTYIEPCRKRKRSASMSNPSGGSQWHWKKLRQTKARQQPHLPRQQDSFFKHLDRDIRNRVYGYLTFDPLLHPKNRTGRETVRVGICGYALAATCRQAKQETDEEAEHQLRQFVAALSSSYRQDTGDKLGLSRHLINTKIPITKDLALVIRGNLPAYNTTIPDYMWNLLCLQLRHLTVHFTGGASEGQTMNTAALRTFLANAYMSAAGSFTEPSMVMQRLTVSWDFRDSTEDVTIHGHRIEYDQGEIRRLRSGVSIAEQDLPFTCFEQDKEKLVGRLTLGMGPYLRCRPAFTLISRYLRDRTYTHSIYASMVRIESSSVFQPVE